MSEARDEIRELYAGIGRYDEYEGPSFGEPLYEQLSRVGQQYADSGMVPEDAIGRNEGSA